MKKVLIIRGGSLGDLILTVPVFWSLKKNNFIVYLLGRNPQASLLKRLGVVDEVIGWDSPEGIKFFTPERDLSSELSTFHLVLNYSTSPLLIENLRRNFTHTLVNFDPLPSFSLSMHMSEYLLQPLISLGIKVFKDWKVDLEGFSEARFISVHPGSGSKKKNWGREKFLALLNWLVERYEVLVLLGEAEREDIPFWEKEVRERKATIVVEKDLWELSLLLKRSKLYIGNDSGITHLAAFLGVPTLAIFGPTNPLIWKPLGEKVRIVVPQGVDCAPCSREEREECREPKCLNSITLEEVRKEVEKIIEIPSPEPHLHHPDGFQL